jgi:hypothetical protein
MEEADKGRGLYQKFHVLRTDGTSATGGKHENCEYFVLDLTHDPFAYEAIRAYLLQCKREYPKLAADLTQKLIEMQKRDADAKRRT